MQCEFGFLDSSIKDDLIFVIGILLERKPVQQLGFIAAWCERLATAMEKASERKEIYDCAKEIESEMDRVNRIDLKRMARDKATEDKFQESLCSLRQDISSLSVSDMDFQQVLIELVNRVTDCIPFTTCYAGRVSGDSPSRLVSYFRSNENVLSSITLEEGKGVTWKLLSSTGSSLIYIEDVSRDNEVAWLCGEPRCGSLLLIKLTEYAFVESQASEVQYIFGLDTVGKPDGIRQDVIRLLESVCETITANSRERCMRLEATEKKEKELSETIPDDP